jgi:hypothetical protein
LLETWVVNWWPNYPRGFLRMQRGGLPYLLKPVQAVAEGCHIYQDENAIRIHMPNAMLHILLQLWFTPQPV